ncbi:MAG TPA: SUMF1/EgtB/PvdO family nonheme iron enzyme [Kofleriaceae bacterium]|nr:SUMF1/EgtB/PvdO family nonheme iron enzyme [Kofleriaceae bacterium]
MKVLFISANTGADLKLNEEYRRIEQRIESSRFRDKFELVPKLAVRLEDLQRALLEHRPDVVHFACHGSERAELVLLTMEGAPAPVPADVLASYFRILRDNVVLVVMNACFASEQAAAVRKSIGVTIGMRERIADSAAILFSGSLYEGLAYGRSVRESFELAATAISASGSEQGAVPELFEGDGIDASTLCLVGERPPGPSWSIWILAITVVCVLSMLTWRWSHGGEVQRPSAQPIADARPIVDASPPAPAPAETVRFTGARIRPGVFDRSQRPRICAAVDPAEDCASLLGPYAIPEIALDDFYLDQHEVTNREFVAWLDESSGAWRRNATDPVVLETRTEPSVFLVRTGKECSLIFEEGRVHPGREKANQPVTCVTRIAAQDYCRARGKRLPLELEWELAAKGSEGRPFPWGASMPKHDGVAFDRGNSTGEHPVDVGLSEQDRTPQGIHDLGGNVSEWVTDGRGASETATIRGGSWNSNDPCRLLGSSCKRVKAERFSRTVGFRCARSVTKDKEEQ